MKTAQDQPSGSGDVGRSLFERHRRLTLALVLIVALIVPVALLEIGLRIVGAYDPFDLDFYAIEQGADRVAITPYGPIRFNRLGYPDEEFDLADPRPRVGYIGDSVVFGLGVGHGYRISDHMRQGLSDYQHFTIGESGTGVPTPEQADRLVAELGLNKFIYVMNLNDVRPTVRSVGPTDAATPQPFLRRVRDHAVFRFVDQLRLHSRAYNMLRLTARNALMRMGYDAIQGEVAYELHPNAYRDVLTQTAERVRELSSALGSHGVTFCVVILPYEMQISSRAERYYSELGIEWEPGFPERSTQEALRRELGDSIQVLDGYHAFVRDGYPEDRDAIETGQFYVNRAGGALDWNHPNRLGHERLAEYLLRERPCSL